MQDLVAKESESEEVRLGIGQRVKIINRAQLGQHFPKPVHEAMLSTPGDEGRCLPTLQELTTLWERQMLGAEPNGLEAGESGEVTLGAPNY